MNDPDKLFSNINTYISIINDKVKLNKFFIKADRKFNSKSKERIFLSNQNKKFSNFRKFNTESRKKVEEFNHESNQERKDSSNIKDEYENEKTTIQNEFFMIKNKKLLKKIVNLRNKVNKANLKGKCNEKNEEIESSPTEIDYQNVKYNDLKNEIMNEYDNFQESIDTYNNYILSLRNRSNEKKDSSSMVNSLDLKEQGKEIKKIDFNLFLNFKKEIIKKTKLNDSYYNSYNFQRLFQILNKEDLSMKINNDNESYLRRNDIKEKVDGITRNKVRIYSKEEIENKVLQERSIFFQKKKVENNDFSSSIPLVQARKPKLKKISHTKTPFQIDVQSSSLSNQRKKKNSSLAIRRIYNKNTKEEKEKRQLFKSYSFHNKNFENEGNDDNLHIENIFKEEVIERKLRDYNSMTDFEVFRIDSLLRSLQRMNKSHMNDNENKEEYEKLIKSLVLQEGKSNLDVKKETFPKEDSKLGSHLEGKLKKKVFYTNKLTCCDNESLLVSLNTEIKKVKKVGIELFGYKPNKKNEKSMYISYKNMDNR